MKWPRIPYAAVIVLSIILPLLAVGAFANSQIQINNGNIVDLSAGKSAIAPCDNDVNITPIILNDGNNVWVQGFQYDNVDKPACVGYDFETRFASSAPASLPLYATSSISSDPYVIRVYAPTSSSNWSLGLGTQPTAEATVTQLSASSFKVIFTNPVSAVTDFGKVVMAEIAHLPVGTFANGYSQLGSTRGKWQNSCLVANNTKAYAVDVSSALFQSTNFPAFPGSVSGIGFSNISDTAFSGGGYWYGLGCSGDGKYLAVSGTSNRIAYSSDYGATWQNKNSSSYLGTGTVGGISISNDGSIVAISVGVSGYFNFWVNGNFWTSTTSAADASYRTVAGSTSSVKVCRNGTTIYGAGGTNSDGVYRWQTSAFTSGGNKANVNPTNKNSSFGSYIMQVDCSADGQSAVISSYTNSNVYVTRDQFATSYTPAGLSTSTNGSATRPQAVSMSANGQFIAVGTGDTAGTGPLIGTSQYSTDFGQNLTATSYTNHYMQTITVANDGSRLIVGGSVANSPFVILSSN